MTAETGNAGPVGYFHRKANEAGFVAITCTCGGNTSSGGGWNNHNPRITGWDDFDYISAVINRVRQSDNCNDAFVCGFSKGGHTAYAYACERPEMIKAVSSVDESMVPANVPTAPVPAIAFHGTADGLVSFTMGRDALETWRRLDGRSADVRTTARCCEQREDCQGSSSMAHRAPGTDVTGGSFPKAGAGARISGGATFARPTGCQAGTCGVERKEARPGPERRGRACPQAFPAFHPARACLSPPHSCRLELMRRIHLLSSALVLVLAFGCAGPRSTEVRMARSEISKAPSSSSTPGIGQMRP
jgi:hypothetical protein